MNNSKYIPLAYSKKISKKRVHIFIMQHEFIPCQITRSNISTYTYSEEGLNEIKKMIVDNDSYLERYKESIVLQSYIQKPLPTEDWNTYALQRLVNNNLLDYDNVIIVYDTSFRDIITVRI
jgi:hypothetical protein